MIEEVEQNNYFYLVDSGSDSNQHMFSDVKKMNNVKQITSIFLIKNPVLRTLNKIHLSTKINKVINLPLKGVWDRFYLMNEKKDEREIMKWIIVTNWSICRFGVSYLKELEQREDYKLVLLYLDPLSSVSEFYLNYIRPIHFDLIYSFDITDCKKYGWIYVTSLYSKTDLPTNESPENDVYYIGLDKGRSKFVERIHQRLTEQGVKCDFTIVSEDGKKTNNGNGLKYTNHRISYDEVLQGVYNSRIIMEIVQCGQSGMTMRPYEAIFYNKKLLTNNQGIREMEFYRNDYMRVFSSENDIDIDFIVKEDIVNYEYHGQYSPIHWIRKIPSDYAALNKQKKRIPDGKN